MLANLYHIPNSVSVNECIKLKVIHIVTLKSNTVIHLSLKVNVLSKNIIEFDVLHRIVYRRNTKNQATIE